MYELSRVRLHSIGPRGARYQDVTLDLRGVGEPIARPVQGALFGDAEESGPGHRPSPATVLFLENGGGKSVLLKLIFSVMLPFRRQVVGTTSTRVLENFVLAQDVAQVALEWQHSRTGQRVVTGKVSAWRDHVVSADPNRLTEAWYSFRPTATTQLDTLPFTDQGKLVTLNGFRDRMDEAGKKEPELQWVWERGRENWTLHLANLELDPQLFVYQRRMNAGEGEAADVLTFRTDEAFVDWLLTAVTGEDDPRGLSEVVTGYAARLAERQSLQDERDFVAGALERIGPLAAYVQAAEQATAEHRAAQQAAREFTAAIRARRDQEQHRLDRLTGEVAEAGQAARTAEQNARRLNKIVLELRRLLAGLRWREAQAVQERLHRELDQARTLHQAWQQTEPLVRHTQARLRADAVRDVVRQQEHEAAPALARRNQAAQRLARGLLAAAKSAQAQASSYEQEADGLADRAAEESTLAEAAVGEAATARQRAAQAASNMDSVQREIQAAVSDGLLDPDADVAQAAAQAQAEATAAEDQHTQARTRLGWVAAQRRVAGQRLRDAEQAQRATAAATAEADRNLAAAQRAAAALAQDERLTGLLGVDQVQPDPDTPTLLDLLEAALTEAEAELTRLRMADAADERALSALGTGGLLPPAEELTEAVRVLESHGITAWAGWHYLANQQPDERERMLAAYPHLVGGIVLNRAEQLDQARQVLAAARLLPRAIVAVGTTATLTRLEVAGPAGLAFLVEPNPAMYDPQTAAREREQLLATRAQRQHRLSQLAGQLRADQRLRDQLTSWRDTYPPGTLAALQATHEQARQAQTLAEAEVAGCQDQLDDLEQQEKELAGSLAGRHEAEVAAAARANQLAALAQRAALVPGWQAEQSAARAEEQRADQAADGHRAQADQRRAQAQTARLTAGDHQRTARSCREELRNVPGAGDLDEAGPVPPEPVADLRSAYEAANAAYQQMEVGADLRAELAQAEQAEAGTRADVERIAPDLREQAAGLLSSPDGADVPARAAAIQRAAQAVATLDAQHGEQLAEVKLRKSKFDELPRQEVALEPYGKPRDIPYGEELLARAEADWAAARARSEQVEDRLTKLREQAGEAEQAERSFRAHLDALAGVGDGAAGDEAAGDEVDPAAEPFPGSEEQARSRRTDLIGRLRDAEAHREEKLRAVRRASDELAGYATQERFEQVTSPVRRQITAVERERLPEHAADWERALRPRLRTLEQDLAQIEQHRASIVERLQGMVQQALRTLQTAQKLSHLPDGLGDWSGQEFLRIRFTEPDPAVLADKLGQVVDEAAAGDGKGGAAKREGLSLLLHGVRAAMSPKGVRVEMLKPDAVLRTERVRVAEIGDVFSGGQLLTAAIILYCTMAHLRANERGYTRRPHAGVLFLDNPIGRASAGYLLELQLKVAEALQVQLIYTTGLFDVSALSVFPLIVRLRNDADLRAGLKYLSVEAHLTEPLARLPEPDGTATVTSTRLFRRPARHG